MLVRGGLCGVSVLLGEGKDVKKERKKEEKGGVRRENRLVKMQAIYYTEYNIDGRLVY